MGPNNRSETELYTKRILAELVSKLRRHFRHANTEKTWDKLRRILTLCRIVVPETAVIRSRLRHLDYGVREFFDYLDSNKGTLLGYGKRYRAGKPISTAMAESAVNQIVNPRMCKRQQMRWVGCPGAYEVADLLHDRSSPASSGRPSAGRHLGVRR